MTRAALATLGGCHVQAHSYPHRRIQPGQYRPGTRAGPGPRIGRQRYRGDGIRLLPYAIDGNRAAGGRAQDLRTPGQGTGRLVPGRSRRPGPGLGRALHD
ncbi:hypothetical protein G6F57_018062 [Rhizopus arrhizus]|nr:hypothetical protein G6F57_018062 [Rhizopus arrhizus]